MMELSFPSQCYSSGLLFVHGDFKNPVGLDTAGSGRFPVGGLFIFSATMFGSCLPREPLPFPVSNPPAILHYVSVPGAVPDPRTEYFTLIYTRNSSLGLSLLHLAPDTLALVFQQMFCSLCTTPLVPFQSCCLRLCSVSAPHTQPFSASALALCLLKLRLCFGNFSRLFLSSRPVS